MPFPTTSVIDNFNRADANNLGANWSAWALYGGSAHFNISGNRARMGFWWYEEYYDVSTYGPDCEVFLTISTLGIDNYEMPGLTLRLQDIASESADGYRLVLTYHASAVEDWRISRIDNGTSTQLGATFTQAVAAGDSIGLEAIGSTLAAYHKPSAGSWSSALTTRTDTAYSTAGYIGMTGNDDNTQYLDDFGGGTVVAGPGAAASLVLIRKAQRLMHILTR